MQDYEVKAIVEWGVIDDKELEAATIGLVFSNTNIVGIDLTDEQQIKVADALEKQLIEDEANDI